ncbi:GlxA family transcriptional regulator [Bradyrhizobium sp.]|uniref:GlxA family transcriptional regulator n=1 Tax=Bradyrhizobium sp. TaxID=376 RepID=UPI0039E3B978
MASSPTIEIGVVNYSGAQLACVYGLTDLFGVANRLAAKREDGEIPILRISHWQSKDSTEPPHRTYDSIAGDGGNPTVLIIPPCLGYPPTPERAAPFIEWLRIQHRSGAILSSICAGAFVLGETGLLAGRTVTTHWAYADLFRTRFPATAVDIDKLLIEDGDIVTAGGVMAWTDVGLKLVDRFLGPTIMAETARTLVVDPPGREQRFYSAFSPNLRHGDAAILGVQHWLQASGAKDASLTALAAHAGLERRTFLRRFRKATGMTATDYCQRLRVGKACELLQFSTASVDNVAWDVGYGDASAFRKVFARVVGLTPAAYRQRFHAPRRPSSPSATHKPLHDPGSGESAPQS